MRVCIVTPSYRCADCLVELHERLVKMLKKITSQYQIIIVNDGSPDNDWEIIRQLSKKDRNVLGINLSRNFGHQAAVSSGLDIAKGDIIIIMDADLQDPPEVIPDMIQKHMEGYDVVYAVRSRRKSETLFKKATAKFFYRLMNTLSEVSIPLDSGDFRLLSKRANEELKKLNEKNRFIRGLTSWIGFPQTGIEYVRDKRFSGESSYTLTRLIKFSLDGITSFTKKPLSISILVGFILSALGFAYMIYVLICRFLLDNMVVGWASLIIVVLFTSGMQMIMLGIVGEYIGRIYDEAKGRPLYIVKEIIGGNNGKTKK